MRRARWPLLFLAAVTGCDSGFLTKLGPPIIQLNTDLVDFGQVTVGARAERSAVVVNAGQTALQVTAIALGGRDPSAFDHAPKEPFGVPPESEVGLSLAFTPPAAGDFEASITVASDASNAASITLRLRGTGVPPREPADAGFANDAEEVVPDAAPDASPDASADVSPDALVEPDAGFVDSGPISFLLEAETTGGGRGVIVSDPIGIDCNPDCRARFAAGSRVTLTASAARGSSFSRWSGDCLNVVTTTCAVTMNAARRVGASFEPLSFPVMVVRSGGGAGRVASVPAGVDCGATCLVSYPAGTQVTLTASPMPGSVFAGWTGACSGAGLCVLQVNGPRMVGAVFEVETFELTVIERGIGSGRVRSMPAGIACAPDCTERWPTNTTVTLTASAAADSVFIGWSGACTGTGPCTVVMDAAKTVAASFDLMRFPIAVTRLGAGTGNVGSRPAGISCGSTCSADYPIRTVVTLTATAGASAIFGGWGGDCANSGSMRTCTLTADRGRSVTARFDLPAYAITVLRTGAGTGTVASTPAGVDCGRVCSASFATQTRVTLTAAPSYGSTFTGWSGDCTGTGTCMLVADQDRAVTAAFALDTFALTVGSSGAGAGRITSAPAGVDCGTTCAASYPYRTLVTLNAVPDARSTFGGWSGACSGTGSCVVTMDRARSVTATWNLRSFNLIVNRAGAGAGAVMSSPAGIACGATCASAFPIDTPVTLTAMPSAGSSFAGWSGDCTGMGTCVVTMSAARMVTATFNANGPSMCMPPPPAETDETCAAAVNRGAISLSNQTETRTVTTETLISTTDEDWSRWTLAVETGFGCSLVGYDLRVNASASGGELVEVCLRVGTCATCTWTTGSASFYRFPADALCDQYGNSLPVMVGIRHQAGALSCVPYTLSFTAR